jgi:hypothetical protein
MFKSPITTTATTRGGAVHKLIAAPSNLNNNDNRIGRFEVFARKEFMLRKVAGRSVRIRSLFLTIIVMLEVLVGVARAGVLLRLEIPCESG